MAAVQNKASDIHFHVDQPPALRLQGDILPLNFEAFDADAMNLLGAILTKNKAFAELAKGNLDLDGAYLLPKVGRFRYNIYRYYDKVGIVMRVIPADVPTIDDLNLPKAIKTVAGFHRGLVLVTGATGSGKSSTLAAIVRHINENKKCHIVTIEDPIEYIHASINSRVSQREIGKDTESFARALKSALRQDPDVILLGEMRDIETLDICLKAAETGHLVLSTVHTTDAAKTIGRLIALYPAAEQPAVRIRLAENLKATVSQRLVPAADNKSNIAVQEIMISNNNIQECIAIPEKTGEMKTYIAKGRDVVGSQTFDQHLLDLFQSGQITKEVAMATASNPGDFAHALEFGGGMSAGYSAEELSAAPKALGGQSVSAGEESGSEQDGGSAEYSDGDSLEMSSGDNMIIEDNPVAPPMPGEANEENQNEATPPQPGVPPSLPSNKKAS